MHDSVTAKKPRGCSVPVLCFIHRGDTGFYFLGIFSNTADTSVLWINVLDMSSRILSHICQARTLLWWCVSSLWGEQGPISHSWEIG